MSNNQPLLIQELAEPAALLVFDGTNKVDPNVAVPMRRRTKQVWNPGNDKATVHDMGVAYDPITITTRFHDDVTRLLGETPEALLRQARGLCLRGNQCRLSWGDSIVRTGRVKSVTPQYVRSDDIIVEIEFEVDGAAEPGAFIFRRPPAVAKVAQIRVLADQIIDAYTAASAAARFARSVQTNLDPRGVVRPRLVSLETLIAGRS